MHFITTLGHNHTGTSTTNVFTNLQKKKILKIFEISKKRILIPLWVEKHEICKNRCGGGDIMNKMNKNDKLIGYDLNEINRKNNF